MAKTCAEWHVRPGRHPPHASQYKIYSRSNLQSYIDISLLPLTTMTFRAPTPLLFQFQTRFASLTLSFELVQWFQCTATVCVCPCPKRFLTSARPFIIPRTCFLNLPSCSLPAHFLVTSCSLPAQILHWKPLDYLQSGTIGLLFKTLSGGIGVDIVLVFAGFTGSPCSFLNLCSSGMFWRGWRQTLDTFDLCGRCGAWCVF